MAPEHRAVFLGGSGFIGSRVVAALAQAPEPWTITVVSRQKQKPPHCPPQVNWVQGDVVHGPHDPWLMALASCSHVFYGVQFPGHPVENRRKGLTYEAYDLGGLQNVLAGLERLGSRPRILYLSGAGAGQGRPQPWYKAKDGAESLLQGFSKKVGTTFLSLRPSVVYGQGDQSLNRLLSWARHWKVLPLLGDGAVSLQPIWVEDLARAFVTFGFQNSLGGSFDFPGPEQVTFRQLLIDLCEIRGVKPWPLPSPLLAAKCMGYVAQCLPGQLLSAGAVDFLTTSVVMDPSPVFDDFLPTCLPYTRAFAQYTS